MWLKKLQEEVGSEVTNESLKEFIWNTLNSGQVRGVVSGCGYRLFSVSGCSWLWSCCVA